MAGGYQVLDHTADIALTAWSTTPAGAFAQAALGMFAIILGTDPTAWQGRGGPAMLDVAVQGRSWESLLVAWLDELLYHFDAEAFVVQEAEIDTCTPPNLHARVRGRYLADPSEAGGVIVKAITYHDLRVEIGPDETRIHVVLDI